MAQPGGAEGRMARDLERLIFFSDAVVAITITLLVIELLRLPDLGSQPSDADLRAALASLAPQIFSVVLSFVVIALWWTTHHRLFSSVVRLDGWLLVLDLAFLSVVAFLPFPTSVLASTTLPTSVALYGVTNAAIGYLIVAMREHADRADLLAADVPRDVFRRRTRRSLLAPTVFAASVPLAYVSGVIAAWSWNLIWVLTLALRRWRGPSGPY
ncbi:MAG: TMEM175 family protein [Candidatus Limnocylindrales bacterium]